MFKSKNITLIILLIFGIFSCTKKEVKESIIKEVSMEQQVRDAYLEGKNHLKKVMFYSQPKNLMKQRLCFLNQIGHQELL